MGLCCERCKRFCLVKSGRLQKLVSFDAKERGGLHAIEHYGEVATFPIYGGKKHLDGTYTARYFNRRDLLK